MNGIALRILLGVDDATLTGVAPRLVLGSVEDLKQPDAMIIDRAGFQFMWPGEEPGIGKVVELNDHRAVIIGISDASAPFTTYPIVYTKYSSARKYVGRTRKQMSIVLVHARQGVDTRLLAQQITIETGLKALTWREFTWATIGYYLRRTGIPVNFGITVALGFIVGAAVVGQTFYIFVLENLRQFGAPRPWASPTARSCAWFCCRPWSSRASVMRSASGCASAFSRSPHASRSICAASSCRWKWRSAQPAPSW